MNDKYSFSQNHHTTNQKQQQKLFSPVPRTSADPKQQARPMTSVRAAGYSSRGRSNNTNTTFNQNSTLPNTSATFDPFNQGRGNTDSARRISEEESIKTQERKISMLVDESILSKYDQKFQIALEKAKEAGKRERQLTKQKEQIHLSRANDPTPATAAQTQLLQPNLDMTYLVLLNLASCYHSLKMYQEALNTYSVIAKNKMFNQSGRLRVNMGNIYFEQFKYTQAIKMYRMALDQIPQTNKEIRLKITRNIGIASVKQGNYQDAITSFESIVESNSDYHAALGDRERMKKGFQKLCAIKPPQIEQTAFDDLLSATSGGGARSPSPTNAIGGINFGVIGSGVGRDGEGIEDHEVRRKATERYIIFAAKLVAANIESTGGAVATAGGGQGLGYDWVVETIRASPHLDIAFELEIAKAVQFLKTKEFSKAIESLKSFEKKDQKMMGTAATNLSFLYLLENDIKNAEKYSEIAINSDRYNAKALTNMGNCFYLKGNFEKAKNFYSEAISVDAQSVESMYNLGLVYKETKAYPEALKWFEKLHSILRNHAEVIYQIADINDKMGNFLQSMEWFNILISCVPTDPGILARIGEMFLRENDSAQAFQSYSESFRYFPSNLGVLAWLGTYYVECEIYDQALQFFERAATIQPTDPKWQLLIASCHRRQGSYQKAYETYKSINDKFPENVECLRFLVRICTDLGMKEVHEYIQRLSKAEKGGLGAGNNNGSGTFENEAEGSVGERFDTVPSHLRGNARKKSAGAVRRGEEEDNWNDHDVDMLLP